MSARETVEAWLCPDCTVVASNYATSLTDDFDFTTEDGVTHFSKTPCALCHSPLAGERYRFAQWLNETEPTLPCVTCGTPVPADIHAEELGFCQPCQADYFDHSDEEN